MKNSALLRLQLNEAFDWLDDVVRDLNPEQYSWQPDGSANPISKLHAHTLSSADFWMNLQSAYELDLARQQSGKAIQRIPKRSDLPAEPRPAA